MADILQAPSISDSASVNSTAPSSKIEGPVTVEVLRAILDQCGGIVVEQSEAWAPVLHEGGFNTKEHLEEALIEDVKEIVQAYRSKNGQDTLPTKIYRNITNRMIEAAGRPPPPQAHPQGTAPLSPVPGSTAASHASGSMSELTAKRTMLSQMQFTARLVDTGQPAVVATKEFLLRNAKRLYPFETQLQCMVDKILSINMNCRDKLSLQTLQLEEQAIDMDVNRTLAGAYEDLMGKNMYNTWVKHEIQDKDSGLQVAYVLWTAALDIPGSSIQELMYQFDAESIDSVPADRPEYLYSAYHHWCEQEDELQLLGAFSRPFDKPQEVAELKYKSLMKLAQKHMVLTQDIHAIWCMSPQQGLTPEQIVQEIKKKFRTEASALRGRKPMTRAQAVVAAARETSGVSGPQQICRQWATKGSCTFGSRCKFVHANGPTVNMAIIFDDASYSGGSDEMIESQTQENANANPDWNEGDDWSNQ